MRVPTALRRMGRRPMWLRAAVAGLVTLSIASLGFAAASALGVSSSDIESSMVARCSTATYSVHVNPTGLSLGFNKTAVRITNFPAECNPSTVVVSVSNTAGTLLASGTGTCTTSPCTITTGSYNATQVTRSHVLANTWGMTSSWDSVCNVFFGIFMNCT